ncbi:hypothetical protein BY458DRAFT_169589 [Sporodiniella umbellata]|nr:hypothetical protein BY458DRAFT_169589 [Sporodiniella umbellata]
MNFDYPPSPPYTPTKMMNLPTPNNSTTRPSLSTRSMSIKENVQVMVRCRPKSKKESDEKACWIIDTHNGAIELASVSTNSRLFSFGTEAISLDTSVDTFL